MISFEEAFEIAWLTLLFFFFFSFLFCFLFVAFSALPGFPTLKNLSFGASLRVHGANLFGHESRNPSIVFTMTPNEETSEQLGRKILGRTCFVDWPFLREAQAIAVTDHLFAYTLDAQKQVVATPLTHEQLDSYPKIMKSLQTSLEKKGIFTGVISSILHVTPLKGLKVDTSGGLVKEYSNEVMITIPAMTVFQVEQEDPRFVPQPPTISLDRKYPVGHSIVFLGKKGYGSVGVIGKHPADETRKLNIKLTDMNEEDAALLAQLSEREVSEHYTALYSVAKQLNISMRVLNRLTASFYVKDHEGERVNVGLNFKFSKQNQKVLGYSRRRVPEDDQTEGVWELSRKAVDLIQMFQKTFPDFFLALEDLPIDEKVPTFLEVTSSPAEFQKIVDWRAAHKLDKLPTVDCDFETFSGARIKKIEEVVAAHLASKTPAAPKPVKDVPPEFVLLPSRFNDSVLEGQEFALGDRVLFALDFGTLPFGLKGVIVGVTRKYPRVEVLFDEPTFAGTDLDGRSSKQRGAIVRTSSLLNLTNRQLPLKKGPAALALDPEKPSTLAALLSSSSAFPSSMLPLQSLLVPSNPSSPGPGGAGRQHHNQRNPASPARPAPVRPVASRGVPASTGTPVKQTPVTKELSYSSMLAKPSPAKPANVPPSPGQARVPTYATPPLAHQLPTPPMAGQNVQASRQLLFMLNPDAAAQTPPFPALFPMQPFPYQQQQPYQPQPIPAPARGTAAENSRQASIAILNMIGAGSQAQAAPQPPPLFPAPAAAVAPTAANPAANAKARDDIFRLLGQPQPQSSPQPKQPPASSSLSIQTVVSSPSPSASSSSPSPSPSKAPQQQPKPQAAANGEPKLLLPNMMWKGGADGPKKK